MFNADKTHLMIVGTSQRIKIVNPAENCDIRMENCQLTESEEMCEIMLGVVFQPNLKWTKHVINLQSRLKERLKGLMKIRFLFSYGF